MLLDMLEYAHHHPLADHTNLLVASKDVPEQNTELFSVMQALKKRGYRVFFVVPDDLPESKLPSSDTASLIWRWTILFDGDEPLDNGSESEEDSDTDCEEESSSQVPQKRQNTKCCGGRGS
ncbi:unnamed protein product [Microthlaspi erraticum]|uniref:NYN domain-containing protein n=1 Tax=Microthlaspi erraticum TaxID=1685480 RepID=A0A6D2KQI5_9BRAS|nr:unnamed protein product [Microthlaspi erraticum]